MVSGIAGTSQALVAKTVRIEGIPKMEAIFTSKSFLLAKRLAPIADEIPTIKREYAVDSTTSSPMRYTKTGTVRIEPPPPIKPSVAPIIKAQKKPIISMNSMNKKPRKSGVSFNDYASTAASLAAK